MKTYQLDTQSNFINPIWFNQNIGKSFDAEVAADGLIDAHGERLRFTRGESLPASTKVRVTIGRNFTCCTMEDLKAHELLHAKISLMREQEREQQELDRRARKNQQRAEAIAFNATLKLPAPWDVGIKDVLSGLSETSWGDGRNRATVEHILLLEDLNTGRLQRKKGDFLCTSNGNNGKRYSSQTEERWVDGDGNPYQPKVSCKKCLEIAKRWITNPENKTGDTA